MLQNAPNCTIPKKIIGEACPQTNAWLPLPHASQAALRHASSPIPKKLAPLANPAYAHGLLLRNLFEEMRS